LLAVVEYPEPKHHKRNRTALDGDLETAAMVITSILNSQALPDLIFATDHGAGQSAANAKEDKKCPLPTEWVDCDAEGEPPDQLKIGKEVKSCGGAMGFEEARHVDPSFHPEGARTGKRVNEEHE
jgi:hypothetical protein